MSDDTYADGTPVPDERPVEIVWECWVKDDRSSFNRFDRLSDVQAWVIDVLPGLTLHETMFVVPHLKSEYTA